MRSFSFFALLLASVCTAQQPWSIGARGHFGFLWPHRPSSWILVEGHAAGTEVFMERTVRGDRLWHQAYGMPRYGFLLVHTRMANPGRIGDAIGLIPYMNMPLIRGERLSLGLRLGWGIGYIARPFDRHDNTRQIAIGSRINTAIQLMPELAYTAQRIRVTTGIALDHWSNGSFKLPNLGLNYLSLSLGASYALNGAAAPVLLDSSSFERPKREFVVFAAGGVSESGRPINGQRSVYVLSFDASWRVGRKGSLGGGVDLFNKGDLATLHAELEHEPRAELTQLGVHASGALLMGRSELLLQMGAYIYTPMPDDAAFYQRIGGRYHFGRHLVLGMSLKTHFATADHWELGIGYRWN